MEIENTTDIKGEHLDGQLFAKDSACVLWF